MNDDDNDISCPLCGWDKWTCEHYTKKPIIKLKEDYDKKVIREFLEKQDCVISATQTMTKDLEPTGKWNKKAVITITDKELVEFLEFGEKELEGSE